MVVTGFFVLCPLTAALVAWIGVCTLGLNVHALMTLGVSKDIQYHV